MPSGVRSADVWFLRLNRLLGLELEYKVDICGLYGVVASLVIVMDVSILNICGWASDGNQVKSS